MATAVRAGQNLLARVTVANIGGEPSQFIITGQIRYKNGAHAGWFTPTPVDYCGIVPPTGFNEARITLGPGQQATLSMYKVNWGCGKNDAFADGEYFDVLWSMRCLNTGEVVTRTDQSAIQHRRTATLISGSTYGIGQPHIPRWLVV